MFNTNTFHMIRDHEIKEHIRTLVGQMDELKKLVRSQPLIQFKTIQKLNAMNMAINKLMVRLKELRQ